VPLFSFKTPPAAVKTALMKIKLLSSNFPGWQACRSRLSSVTFYLPPMFHIVNMDPVLSSNELVAAGVQIRGSWKLWTPRLLFDFLHK
jgi:hypothetical protein